MPRNKPDSVWVLENCLVPDLKGISPDKDEAFYTDLRGKVLTPDFHPTNEAKIWEQFSDAAILCWISRMGDSRTIAGGLLGEGRRRRAFSVFFQGGLKAERGSVQSRVAALAEDHFRVMDRNPARDQPGGSLLNTWGINTTLSPEGDYVFHWEKIEQGLGSWTCEWVIDLGESV